LRSCTTGCGGKRFGEKVHRVFEAYPPVTDPWPATGAALPVLWDGEEERRWNAIVVAVRSSPLYRELRSSRVVGTELPLLRVRSGAAARRAPTSSFVFPDRRGSCGSSITRPGARPGAREGYFLQLREYRDILSGAWRVPVRGILWYVETGASFEVNGPASGR